MSCSRAGELDEEGLLKKLPALNGAIMETMRLYPIAVAQMRTANKDFVFEGHQIHEGEMIYVGTSVPHFMEEYWPKANTFDIDRYQKPRAEHLQPGVYSPYGRGPHTCLGQEPRRSADGTVDGPCVPQARSGIGIAQLRAQDQDRADAWPGDGLQSPCEGLSPLAA